MTPKLKLSTLQDVHTQEVNWLWHPFIPAGKITIVQGDPGEGKTTMVLSAAASITTGAALPNGNPTEPANVIFQTAEDGYADTIKPRLISFGADCSRVHVIDEEDYALSLSDKRIEEAIVKINAKLLVLDPLQAYFGGRSVNSASCVRPLMKSIGDVAERTGCAIVIIGHMNKSGSKALYRGLGSIDIPAAARSILTVGRIDEYKRAFVQTKSNLAPAGKPQSFRLDPDEGFAWCGDVEITIDELLGNAQPAKAEKQLEKAMRLLGEILADGAKLADEVVSSIVAEGVSRETIKRAKKALSVRSFKQGDPWYWELPTDDEDGQDGQVCQPDSVNHLNHMTPLNHMDASADSSLGAVEVEPPKPQELPVTKQSIRLVIGDGVIEVTHHDENLLSSLKSILTSGVYTFEEAVKITDKYVVNPDKAIPTGIITANADGKNTEFYLHKRKANGEYSAPSPLYRSSNGNLSVSWSYVYIDEQALLDQHVTQIKVKQVRIGVEDVWIQTCKDISDIHPCGKDIAQFYSTTVSQ